MKRPRLPDAATAVSRQAAENKEPLFRYGTAGQPTEFAEGETITFPGSVLWKYTGGYLTKVRAITSLWSRYLRAVPARGLRYAVAAAMCGVVAVIVIATSTASTPSAPTGAEGCTAVSSTMHQTAAPDYAKIRSLFTRSRWADLRLAGTAYVDLAVKLTVVRNSDGYEAVWFEQRLAEACARHGAKL